MITHLCTLIGHRRDSKRVRPYLDTWRTKCVRCNISLMQDTGGSWQPLLERGNLPYAAIYKSPRASEIFRLEEDKPSALAIALEQVRANGELATEPKVPRADFIPRTETKESVDFFLTRADDCRRRAEVAADSSIRLIHLDMATRYELLAREAGQ